ncbi:DUF6602 domain-containing protein [Metabacillus sediminilitoris]|uniref:DUF6602 domain-containing protein n=1 Tax=Metabacillus sediminilitoris TaxID=2567941 RepID=A0A4S4BUT7_9BACI|nr:DUF6602 domain-containing protein [Metabacillus sediminilitoris]QGQ44771.1 hypothetical protein GMB29_05500 [Metabacillus sediminilitoris]THF78881.1 hypothetical protein E6W99_14205 [Metabacillus sediminilitoris]
MRLEHLFQAFSREMIDELKVLAAVQKGMITEETIKTFLNNHLPSKYSIGAGYVVAHDGQSTGQLDCVIFAHASCPLWYNKKYQILPSESVCAVLEIKQKLTIERVKDAIKIISGVRRLPKLDGYRPIGPDIKVSGTNPQTFGVIFAFETNVSLKQLKNELNKFNESVHYKERPSLVCILNQGILLNINRKTSEVSLIPDEDSVFASVEASSDSFLLFFLFLTTYLNQIEVIPPDLSKYIQGYMQQFKVEI